MSSRGRRNGVRLPRAGALRPTVEPMERRQLLATIRVTSLADALAPPVDGQVTLREAIESINAGAPVNADVAAVVTGSFGQDDRIVFDGLAGTIALAGGLPAISRPVAIDGRTGLGFSDRPVITIDGGYVANTAVTIVGPDVRIRSLSVVRSLGPGIRVAGAGASGAVIAGNHVGVDASGSVALANNGGGVLVEDGAGFATIGVAPAAPFTPGTVGNVIAGNLADNVRVSGGSGVRIQGNFIGTDRSGTVALRDDDAGIDGHGVQLVGGSGHVVGGIGGGEGNLISGNGINGVEVVGSSGVLIAGNRIGTAGDGASPIGNEFLGVRLRDGATGNTVGGANAVPFALSAGNLIANNGGDGIRVVGAGTSGNLIAGNYVGVDASGNRAGQNRDTGIELNNAPRNTVGGADPRLGNLVSGNRGDGLLIIGGGASANLVQGNRIGTDAAGLAAIPNAEDGIELNAAAGNTIGGAAAGAGNLISGNASDGIELEGGASGNLIQGNRIGTSLDGTLAIPNAESGVRLDAGFVTIGLLVEYRGAVGNTIGGVNAATGTLTAGNLISGNGRHGIHLVSSATSANLVLGNFVGTDLDGSRPLGNAEHGILSQGGSGNTIGGANIGLQPGTLRAGNLVSGNRGDGIRLTTLLDGQGRTISASSANAILGNFVGTNAAGTLPIGNAGAGVALLGAPNTVGGFSGNTIGGANASTTGLTAGNLISGNARVGLLVSGAAVSGNLAIGNFVGTNASGTAAVANGRAPTAPGPIDPSGGHGVLFEQGALNNTIGAGNVISGNVHSGVVFDASPGNLVSGSRIGTNASGTAALGNGLGVPLPSGATDPTEADGNGVFLRNGSFGNTIGGANADPAVLSGGNLISGNAGDGVAVHGAGSSGNLVVGNFIGTDLDGNAAVGNGLDGVEVLGASGTTIGGADSGRRNVISGNGSDGVELERGASRNAVLGNYIGTDASGTRAIGNLDVGVFVFGGSDNLIGGNLISGNFDGVRIQGALGATGSPASGNLVVGNFIGTDAAGNAPLANRDDGVQLVRAVANTIGGTEPGQANLISGNRNFGVVIGGDGDPSSGNLLLGNRIGTNAAGSGAIGNGRDGVLLASGASANTVGGVNAEPGLRTAGNLISGNLGSGVRILGDGASANLLLGNFVGTDSGGVAAIGNAGDGVRIEGRPSNTVGGANVAAGTLSTGNLIGGNAGAGVRLQGAGASGNVVLGNFVGSNATGSGAVGNGGHGVMVEGASGNTIGASNGAFGVLTAGNLVSGNAGDGVHVVGASASANVVIGNFVGTDAAGDAAVGNLGAGVRVAAPSNAIGQAGLGNVLSGNGGDGLTISGPSNAAVGNTIGSNAGGTAAIGNAGDGVRVSFATGNTIGGSADGSRNVIAANARAGVRIEGSGASNNVVLGNRIGTNLAGSAGLGNGSGVLIVAGASNNVVGEGNVISGNLGRGVAILGEGATSNAVLGNVIGLGPDGSAALGNGGDGVRVEGADGNSIVGNVVSANVGSGVALLGPGTRGNLVRANRVGTDDLGLASRGNGAGGVVLIGAAGNTVGGLGAAEGNIISGNLGSGVAISGAGAVGNLVLGNVVGLDASGAARLGNGGDGVMLVDGASGNTVGGTSASAGNLISGNGADGVAIAGGSSGNLVSGNVIGADAGGSAALGNGGSGVRISDSGGNTVGGRANLISGNGVFGVAIAGSSASGNLVLGNRIGTDLAGRAGLGTQRVGVVILDAPGNRVEGGNLIAGHLGDGLQLIGPGASGNLVLGNLIGTDEAGRDGLGNARGILVDGARDNVLRDNAVSGNRGDGLVLLGGASGNLLATNLIGLAGPDGGVSRPNLSGVLIVGADRNTLDANVISGNRGFGVAIAGASGNVLSNNLIGTGPQGGSARPNALHGVMMIAALDNALAGNVISANGLYGVELRGGSSGNVLAENFIGTDRAGAVALGNAGDGVHLEGARGNRLEGNVISGNLGDGVKLISDSPENVVVGNLLGTNREGTAALGNRGSGVLIAGASNNAIRGNVTSGNGGFGVGIAGAAGNVVSEGFVGTDRAGASGVGNGLAGVLLLNAPSNLVLNSIISSNGRVDSRGNVRIDGVGAVGNLVLGNRIGTDAAGSRSLDVRAGGVQTGDPELPGDGTPAPGDRATFDPRNDGVVIADGASGNSVGGPGEGQGNLISGNRIGVYVRGRSAGNLISGNRIGTNAEGTAAVANGEGVIVMNSSGNTVGGVGPAARNLISGNLEVGVRLTSIAFDEARAPATENLVAGNYIGTDASGEAALGNRQGIFVYGASGNRIGLGSFADPDGGGNVLSGNREVGVQILNADTINAVTVATPGGPAIVPFGPAVGAVSSGNVVLGNRIGTNAAGTARVPNFQGVFVSDAPGNAVVDNLISGNAQVGLNITAFNAVNNFVGGNRIGPDVFGNAGAVSNGFADPNGLGAGLFLNQVVDNANAIAPTNDVRGNAGQQVRVRAISSGPHVERVTPILDPATGAATRVDVLINGYLDRDAARTLNRSNVAIAPTAGGPAVPIASVSYDEVSRILSITPASPLPAGQAFRVTLVGRSPGGLRSRPAPGIAAAFLDGNVDSRAGDDFNGVITPPARSAARLASAARRSSPEAAAVDALAALGDL